MQAVATSLPQLSVPELKLAIVEAYSSVSALSLCNASKIRSVDPAEFSENDKIFGTEGWTDARLTGLHSQQVS